MDVDRVHYQSRYFDGIPRLKYLVLTEIVILLILHEREMNILIF